MSQRRALLIEIGCEEIPARMIPAAAAELGRRVATLLRDAGLADDSRAVAWGGSRRLTVRVDDVATRQADRREAVTGPPVSVAFDDEGRPTRAGEGFARKLGVSPESLGRQATDRGEYVVVEREVPGRSVGEVLADALPAAVSGMPFPKTMRWADGEHRWVRPVHRLVALHGDEILPIELFGVSAGRASIGHRFLAGPTVEVPDAEGYVDALRAAFVVVDPAERRRRVEEALTAGARELGGAIRPDPGLLDEMVDLVEWPGVVGGTFDPSFLDLPDEILVVTLRHHQKCFSVENENGELLPAFLAIANTDRDPAGHIRRGNEWVVSGRLEDARFFWREDRRTPLEERAPLLERVVFHARVGSYREKAARTRAIVDALAERLGLPEDARRHAGRAAELAKFDLVTGTVGEFPELQGRIGGLMLREEGVEPEVAEGVYEHYRPEGPEDDLPAGVVGSLVSVADKLDSIAALITAGEAPTGSRDPLALRRAGAGLFRILVERDWNLSLGDLLVACGGGDDVREFLADRLERFFLDRGFRSPEIRAVRLPRVEADGIGSLRPAGLERRLRPLAAVRQREDFTQLARLVKRVDTILVRNAEAFEGEASADGYEESAAEALALTRHIDDEAPRLEKLEAEGRFDEVVDGLAGFVDPVERFFAAVLVVDPAQPAATRARGALLARLRALLVRCFDVRELAGQADSEVP